MKDATNYVLAPGVIVEDLGSDSAVLVPGTTEVVTLSGDAADVVRRIRSGESVDGAEAVVSDLVARGVVQPVGGMSRRGVVRAGVIGAGAGIAALAMPSVAAASSHDGESSGGGGGGSVGSLVKFVSINVGAQVFDGGVEFGTVQVSGQDANDIDLGFTIDASDLDGTEFVVQLKDEVGTRTFVYEGNNEFKNKVAFFTGDDPSTKFGTDFWQGGGHTLTFTYKGTEYVVDF